MAAIRSPLHSRQHRLQCIRHSAYLVPAAPCRLFSSFVESLHGDTEEPHATASARMSSLGIALGYAAVILLLLGVLFSVQHAGGSTKALRFAIGGSNIES